MKFTRTLRSAVVKQLKKQRFYTQLLREKEDLEKTNHNQQKIISRNKDILNYKWLVKPGHFYSPLVGDNEASFDHLIDLWNPKLKQVDLPGIELSTTHQQNLLEKLSRYSQDLAAYLRTDDIRYRTNNDQLGKCDTSFIYLMLRHFKPKQIIEVGSGWSSAIMLDLNQLQPDNAAKLTFIDPYPERLYSTLKRGDKKHCTIIAKKVQSVSVEQLTKLKAGDLLFIDNSHVSKSGSDVNYLFFEVLPRLQKGVLVHVHDIFYPFEYPWQWVVEDKRNWNEAYTLRALLSGSKDFEIILWPSYLMCLDRAKVETFVPNATDLGASIWLRKI